MFFAAGVKRLLLFFLLGLINYPTCVFCVIKVIYTCVKRRGYQGGHSRHKSGDDFFYTVVREFPSSNIMEPTQMLKYLQSKIVRGRSLDLSEDAVALSGETNFIAVDRENILESTFEELRSVNDPRITFQADFYGEQAQDGGGPRKEWIRLCNQQVL